MKKVFIIFWKLCLLFFAVPLPMLIYYTDSETNISSIKETNPWLALGILLASIVLWLIVLLSYLYTWVFQSLVVKRNIERLKKEGIRRQAKILSVINLSGQNSKYSTYALSLSFKNLVDVEIVQKAGVNDSKPYEHRFEVGKSVDILIDKDIKGIPYFILASLQTAFNKTYITLIIIAWLAIITLVTGYYIYAYQSESFGMGWRFIGFGHPLIICPVVLLFYIFLAKFVLKLGRIGKPPTQDVLIKFKGVSTTAKVISVNQTGMFINQQPLVNFEFEYTDHRQRTHRKSFKKVVDLLEMDTIKKETIDIFYLKENPEHIAFTSDLNKLS